MKELKIARKHRGLTQKELATLANVSFTTLSDMENGIRIPHNKSKIKIESILGPIDWWKTLLKGPDQKFIEDLKAVIKPKQINGMRRIRYAKQLLIYMEQDLPGTDFS